MRSFLATLAVSGKLKADGMPQALEKLNASSIWRHALEAHPARDDAFLSAMRRNDAAAAYAELSRHTFLKKSPTGCAGSFCGWSAESIPAPWERPHAPRHSRRRAGKSRSREETVFYCVPGG